MPIQDIQTKRVDQFVVPIGTISDRRYESGDGQACSESIYESFGTAFFIGNAGYLLTAAHVIDQMEANGGDKVFIIPVDGKWTFFDISDSEKHPTEDVAIVRTTSSDWHSIMQLFRGSEYQTCEYTLWGYPEHVSHELRHIVSPTPSGSVVEKPELVVSKGYIRRRISREFPFQQYIGSNFYEISEVAGSKCSGAPLVKQDKLNPWIWKVIGIYIGESTGSWQFSVGYAVRTDALIDWIPTVLGHNVFDEFASLR